MTASVPCKYVRCWVHHTFHHTCFSHLCSGCLMLARTDGYTWVWFMGCFGQLTWLDLVPPYKYVCVDLPSMLLQQALC